MEHTHIGLPGICRCQGRGQERHQAQPPLHTGYDCCIYTRKRQVRQLNTLDRWMQTYIVPKQPVKEPHMPLKSKNSVL